ncbi:R3H domain-containing nucleic acid-binding protein [Actinomycetaceae bacterium MB13-C1-2]|nr:R3H domain-containing nucleic acid-binding protein [Actinomycetaceae bacterium MB13-C1-2]
MSEKKSSPKVEQLEEEGDVAADYLEEFLDIADFDGDIEIDVENGRASVAIVSDDANSNLVRLVGDDGEVLEALQELTRLAVQASTGERSRLMLDIDGFRAARKAELQEITQDAVDQVKETGEPVSLEAMNPFERKVCHDVVAGAGLRSESEGVEPNRHLIILPTGKDGDDELSESSDDTEDHGQENAD